MTPFRPFQVAGLVAAAIVVLSAATERATFVLTDGKRISGTLVFHTETRGNYRPDTAEFNLGLEGGREIALKRSQIMMVDFMGGRPSSSELSSLGNAPTLVLSDGATYTGNLVDFIGGDTIRWTLTNGQTRDFPVTDARRIYLMPARARAMYPGDMDLPSPTAGTSGRGRGRGAAADGSLQIPGRAQWIDTGITVRRGEAVRFLTTGTIQVREGGPLVSAEGDVGVQSSGYPVPDMPAGALIARIGDNPPFPLGARGDAVAMPHDGRLMLGINDDNFGDNSGGFRVAAIRRALTMTGAVSVAADLPWRDAGLNVTAGERLYFEVTGSVEYGGGNTAGPNGREGVMNNLYAVPSAPVGALVGRITVGGRPFLVGGPAGPITMPATGRLLLGVNDDVFTDNKGSFLVTIWR